MQIRPSTEQELDVIKALHLQAFPDSENQIVADLAIALIKADDAVLSLVAIEDNNIIGNIVFSPMQIQQKNNADNKPVAAYILAPLAVLPSYQKQGIGTALIKQGLEVLQQKQVDAVFVLGDPAYYSRSGFNRNHKVETPYEIPYPEAWLALQLNSDCLKNIEAKAICLPPLMEPEIW